MQAQFLRMVKEEAVKRREHQHHAQKEAIESVIERPQVAAFHFVQHHEAVVLANHVIVGPDTHQDGQIFHPSGEHHRGSDGEKENQAAVQQAGIAGARFAVEIGAAGGGEDVRAVESHRPEPPQQRNGDVECRGEQQVDVAGKGAADDQGEIYTATDDPGRGTGRAGRRDHGGDSGHPAIIPWRGWPAATPSSFWLGGRRGAWPCNSTPWSCAGRRPSPPGHSWDNA